MQRRKLLKSAAAAAGPAEEALGEPRRSERAALGGAVLRQLDKLSAAPLEPALYIVSTPIGNLADITLRALSTLERSDIVVCEDTRHSRKLLSAYCLRKKLEAYHDFSGEKDRERILRHLEGGKSVALISDAGTPLIADPGYKLVRSALERGVAVFAIPGPSAILTAQVASGLPADRFFFAGFLPPKERARQEALKNLQGVPGTILLYESGARLGRTLEALARIFPDRTVAIARELTKLHEEIVRGSAAELASRIGEAPVLGEIVLLVGPGEAAPPSETQIEEALSAALKSASLKEAVEEVTKGLGVARKIVYNLALKMRDKK